MKRIIGPSVTYLANYREKKNFGKKDLKPGKRRQKTKDI